MNPQTEAIYREFPFLEKYFPKAAVMKARVSRITEQFLDKRSAEINPFYDGECSSKTFSNGKILLFDNNGKRLAQVGVRKIWRLFPKEFIESVGQALLRLGRDAPVHYATWLRDGELVVYKPPKAFTMRGWYEEQIRRAQQSVRDNMNAIDGQGKANR